MWWCDRPPLACVLMALLLILRFCLPLSRRHRFAQMEMTKYQLQASSKWSFDFLTESPITHASSQFKWEPTTLHDMPKFYHHISHPTKLMHQQDLNERAQLFSECENICPLSQSISAPSMMIQNPSAVNKRKIVVGVSSASSSFVASTVCSGNQRKITGECSAKKMLPLIASLRLITPKSDLKTINSHQILIPSWRPVPS